jgi:hypothetical protein
MRNSKIIFFLFSYFTLIETFSGTAFGNTALKIMECVLRSESSITKFQVGKTGDDFYASLDTKDSGLKGSFVAQPLKAIKEGHQVTFDGKDFHLQIKLPPTSKSGEPASYQGQVNGKVPPVGTGTTQIIKGSVTCLDENGVLVNEDPNEI